jgi:hypothetical protein
MEASLVGLRYGFGLKTSAQQVGDIDVHCAGRAIFFARHAVPALIKLHVRLALDEIDRKHVEWTDFDANSAALVGNAFFFVDTDRDIGSAKREWHLFLFGQAV